MRRLRTVPPLAIATLIACSVAGCLPLDPAPLPTIAPTGTPLFSSDEEALAAAEEAYAAYLAVSDQIAQEGGANPDRLAAYVTDEWLVNEVDAFTRLAETGRRQIGQTTFRNTALQQYEVSPMGESITVYACLDFGATKFVDELGQDVSAPERLTVATFEIQLAVSKDRTAQLLVSGSELWETQSVC